MKEKDIYDFTTLINRKETFSSKWNVDDNVIPLTIADMDYLTCPPVKKALLKRIKKGVLGYTDVDDSFYESYKSFFGDYFNMKIKKDSLVFSLGVVPTISSCVRAFTDEGDNVVVTPPVYNIFYNSITNNKRVPLEVELVCHQGEYYIDYVNLEKAFADPKTKLFILCNPHNPVGKMYTKEELNNIGLLARKYHVLVISDEIHGLITRPGTKYTPFMNANDFNRMCSITCLSPTKAFNLAGVHTSAIVVDNEVFRKKIVKQINTDEVAEPNVLSIVASTAAFTKGREYLENVNEELFRNKDYVIYYIQNFIPEISVVNSDATYLVWADVRKFCFDSDDFIEFLLKKEKIVLQSGAIYGKGGNGYIRINVATTRGNLDLALDRLKTGVSEYIEFRHIDMSNYNFDK